jgi:hypothetical protein
MAYGGTEANTYTSSYRVKFKRDQFLELVQIAQPELIFHVRRMHFFAFMGFAVYTFECSSEDFSQKVVEAIEFSNMQWREAY